MYSNSTFRRGRRVVLGAAALVAAGGLALAACGSGTGRSSGGASAAATPPCTAVTTAPPTPVPTPTAAPTPVPTIELASNRSIGQNLLVDAKGRTLYLFVPAGTGTQSTVPTQFKPNWPPLVASGPPVAGTGLNMASLGVATQSDGTRQVTYNGHLLDTFINDKAPGDTNGQGLGPNNWFVLDASGNPIGMPPADRVPGGEPEAGPARALDSNSMTLYLFVPDGTGTKTKVPAQFKPNWPQLTATGNPLAGTGLDTAKLTVHAQTDGAQQVAYNGHLLYTFVNDKAPGDTNGQGLGPNNWFVLDANGNPIGAPSAMKSTGSQSGSMNRW
jgi:predicted lipoprotein with Yx(FWY)xxD motif